LTQLDLSNFDTSKVTNMDYMFYYCTNLTQLDLSNFDTSKVTNMQSMFSYCNNLLNIGMLYCTHNTINTIASVLPNNVNRTIYYLDEDINFLNIYDYIEYKEYKESSYTLQLNSPLYEGDKIVVKDDKLCHYHKMGMVVLDGSEDEGLWKNNTYENTIAFGITIQDSLGNNCKVISDTMPTINTVYSTDGLKFSNTTQSLLLVISKSKLSTQDVNGFKQWLQANPITVIYELAEPYYEDITPIQSQWVMSIFEESNLDIITSLPIKSNISYSVSILDTNSLEEELNEVITNKTDLTNLLEDEINN
ncbi:MAG: BspA family leucine-rich repeat surface protein, partial [Bacilli bacterium]|nr:BspA family leucine-rich repeat surface protein [Bacilli bacterium]